MGVTFMAPTLTSCSPGLEEVHMEDRLLDKPLPINTRPRILATGQGFSVGVKKDGTVWSWGSNIRQAYLGRRTASDQEALVPAQVPGLKDAVSVVASSSHTLVLMKDGTVWSWGENNNGQLGYPTKARDSGVPQKIPGLTDVVDIAARSGVSQALKKDGTVWGFGWGSGGRLGRTALEDHNPMMKIDGLQDIVRIEIGYSVSLAIDKAGRLWTYGENERLQGRPLGKNTKEAAVTPGVVGLPRRVVDVSANAHPVYALLEDGTVWSWGSNYAGQLGIGDRNEKGCSLPVRVQSLSSVILLASGMGGAVVTKDGTIATWGTSAGGAPHNMMVHHLAVPYALKTKLPPPIQYLVGGGAYAVVDGNGNAWFWQTNSMGERGTGARVDEPSVTYWITPEKSLWSYR